MSRSSRMVRRAAAVAAVLAWAIASPPAGAALPPPGSISVLDYGAVGDDGLDDTAAIQGAIDAAEAYAHPPPVVVAAGAYDVATLRIRRTVLIGAGRGRPAMGLGAATVLRQLAGVTGHLIEIEPDDPYARSAVPRRLFSGVVGMSLQGRREENRRPGSRIVAAADRHTFTVSPDDLASVALPTNVTPFPHYGLVYFYSGEGRYLGHGLAASIDRTSGRVTLLRGWDNYASRAGAAGLLTGDERVVFSGTYRSGSVPMLNGRADASLAGNGAIHVANDVLGVTLEDLAISHFHFGIARGDGRVIEARHVWMAFNTHGVLSRASAGSDNYWNRLFIQGYYRTDPGLPAERGAYENVEYREQVAGVWLLGSRDVYIDLTVDRAVNGVVDNGGYQWHISNLLLDLPVKYGFLSYHGGMADHSTFGSIGTLAAATPTSMPAVMNLPAPTRAVIALLSSGFPRTLGVGQVTTTRFPGAPAAADFPVLASVVPGNRLEVGILAMDSGVTAPPRRTSGLQVPDSSASRFGITILGHSAVPAVAPVSARSTVLRSIPVPAGAMGPNGTLRLSLVLSIADAPSPATIRVTMSGQTIFELAAAAVGPLRIDGEISNRGVDGAQLCDFTATAPDRVLRASPLVTNVATSLATTVDVHVRASGAVVLEKHTLELLAP